MALVVGEVTSATFTSSRVASSSVVEASIRQAASSSIAEASVGRAASLLVVLVDTAVGTPYVNQLCQFLFISILSILA